MTATRPACALAPARCALFATPIGACGIAWCGAAITHVLLPAADEQRTLALLRRLGGGASTSPPLWPGFVEQAVRAMQALLRGDADEGGLAAMARLPLAWAQVGEFERRVYEAAMQLEPGRTCTYGELAASIGAPDAARAVGVALGRNPWPLVVPCHRITAAGGALGGFSSPGGVQTKRQLLAIEASMRPRPGELF